MNFVILLLIWLWVVSIKKRIFDSFFVKFKFWLIAATAAAAAAANQINQLDAMTYTPFQLNSTLDVCSHYKRTNSTSATICSLLIIAPNQSGKQIAMSGCEQHDPGDAAAAVAAAASSELYLSSRGNLTTNQYRTIFCCIHFFLFFRYRYGASSHRT